MSQTRASCWSVTINNPNQEDEDALSKARSTPGWFVEGQLEKGANGTPHYQLRVKTPQVRFSALKKAFPRAHIEVARNSAALANYVTKEETRVGDLPEQDNKYPSLTTLYDMIYQEFNVDDKDGWDWGNEREVTLYREREQERLEADPLAWFDEVVAQFIRRGYFVEHHAVNPAVRSAWKRFHKSIMFRARTRHENMRQTDRQTDTQSVLDIPMLVTPRQIIETLDSTDDITRHGTRTLTDEEKRRIEEAFDALKAGNSPSHAS